MRNVLTQHAPKGHAASLTWGGVGGPPQLRQEKRKLRQIPAHGVRLIAI
jgi:hypothetical protein